MVYAQFYSHAILKVLFCISMLLAHCIITTTIHVFLAVDCGSGEWVGITSVSRTVCYLFVTDKRAAFSDGQQHCKLHGGSLASMRTHDEMVFVNGIISTRYSKCSQL